METNVQPDLTVPDMRGVKEIHIMPYSHHDYAWTNSREWHIRRYIQSNNEMLEAMKRSDVFTWMIDNVIHSLIPYIEHSPEGFEEMRKRVQEGRVYVANGGYSLARSTYVGGETFIRNMVEGKRFLQQMFGIGNIELFYNADTGCGHSQLPQILRLGGHRYYRFQRPEEALDGKKIPRQFVWSGLDGSRLVISRGTYGGFMDGKFTNMDFRDEWDEAKRLFFEQELKDKIDDLLMTDIVWLNYGCDDYRPLYNLFDDPIDILGFVEEWNKREEVKLLFSDPKTYFERLQPAELPVHEGVLDPCELTYNAPLRGGNSMWRMRGELDRLIVKAEKLAAFASLTGTDYPYRQIEALWKQLFEITGHAIEWIYKNDYEDLYSIATGAKSAARSLIGRLQADIAGKLSVREGSQYVVLNVTNWRRTEPIPMHITSPFGVSGFDLVDNRGNKLDYQVVNICSGDKRYSNCEFNEVDIVVDMDVPAMGYSAVTMVRNGTQLADKVKGEYIDIVDRPFASDLTIMNNGCIELVMERGRISLVKELATGRTIGADRPNAVNGLKFVQTEPSPYWISYWTTTNEYYIEPEKWEIVENGPLRWVYRVIGKVGNNKVKQDIILHKGECAVKFDTELDATGDEGYFTVDFSCDSGTPIHADIPFGVEARELDKEPYGSIPGSNVNYNAFERGVEGQFYGTSWAMYEIGNLPAAVVSENCSIYYRHDADHNVISLLLNRSMPLAGKKELWLLQTHPSIDGNGVHRYTYDLFFPEPANKFTATARFAKAKAQPLDAVPKYNHSSALNLELEHSFLGMDCEHAVVTSFYKENDNYVLRLYETEGRSSTVNLTPGFGWKGARNVDLLGNELEDTSLDVDTQSGRIQFKIKPWQIVTLHIQ